MREREIIPDRIHVIAHAGPPRRDIERLGFSRAVDYLAFVRRSLPAGYRLVAKRSLFEVEEEEWRGGRRDDAARVGDLQAALSDGRTLAIVAANGGAYFTRILREVDFSVLSKRRAPLHAFGFSEMTSLVNLVASYRCGRGWYWLCPNYVAWKLRPRKLALEVFGSFWRALPALIRGERPGDAVHLDFGPIRGKLVRGRASSGRIRVVGGCLAVLMGLLSSREIARRLRPRGRWLFLEDIQEVPYRIDRHLAVLKLAGWFEEVGGVLVGDFRTKDADTQSAVVSLLDLHLPRGRGIPVVTTRSFGHVWPQVPVPVNRSMRMEVLGVGVTLEVI